MNKALWFTQKETTKYLYVEKVKRKYNILYSCCIIKYILSVSHIYFERRRRASTLSTS